MNIIGISAFYHDSSAALIIDGEIVAAAQEERFTRKKHDSAFPTHALRYCLSEANLSIGDIDVVAFYDKPLLTFHRLLETYLHYAPTGLSSYLKSMSVSLKNKFFLKRIIEDAILQSFGSKPKEVLFCEHHESHAASAFYPSAFEKAAVLCLDGVGEWATTSAWIGNKNQIDPLWEVRFPHSLGLLYSAFTAFTGFKVNSGEYKMMGLAPYGRPIYKDKIYKNLIDLKDDGSFRLNMSFFDYCTGSTMTNSRFASLFDGPARKNEARLTQREMDLAKSIQDVTEDVIIRMVRTLHKETGQDNLCMAGGVSLNCVSNGRILKEGPFKKIFIQPAAGDAGSAIGCALSVYHKYFSKPRKTNIGNLDGMKGSYLGPKYSSEEIEAYLRENKIPYARYADDELFEIVAELISKEKVVGWFQGRMEFGPRALGNRSIIGDARSKSMQSIMNLKIKYRESFRPFAPSILRERVHDYFEIDTDSPYMLLTAKVSKEHQIKMNSSELKLWGINLLNVKRSDIPCVTHVDYSARIQTVHHETNPRYHQLLRAFERKTGCPVIVNTSFNVRGEPIVNTPNNAYRCFMRTEMDALVLENFVLLKTDQPELPRTDSWQKEFELD